jgi:hypothetical protein
MDIYIVRDNLVKTIKSKEVYLDQIEKNQSVDNNTVYEYLKENIRELKVILHDVQICCNKALDASWALNPERMGQ